MQENFWSWKDRCFFNRTQEGLSIFSMKFANDKIFLRQEITLNSPGCIPFMRLIFSNMSNSSGCEILYLKLVEKKKGKDCRRSIHARFSHLWSPKKPHFCWKVRSTQKRLVGTRKFSIRSVSWSSMGTPNKSKTSHVYCLFQSICVAHLMSSTVFKLSASCASISKNERMDNGFLIFP